MSWKICCGQKEIKINDQCPPFLLKTKEILAIGMSVDVLREIQRIKENLSGSLLFLNALKAEKRSNLFRKNKTKKLCLSL